MAKSERKKELSQFGKTIKSNELDARVQHTERKTRNKEKRKMTKMC